MWHFRYTKHLYGLILKDSFKFKNLVFEKQDLLGPISRVLQVSFGIVIKIANFLCL
jgi:hypothetical protein